MASAPALLPIPTPAPTPTPAPNDTSVELLDRPATQEFVAATRGEPIRIRYDAGQNRYEIKTAAFDWSALLDPPDPSGGQPNSYFNVAGQPTGWFGILAQHRSPDPDRKYRYSNLASWKAASRSADVERDFVAFGAPTPASGIPLTGGASFVGFASGTADVPNDGWGPIAATPLDGTVRLNFDFGAGALSGSLGLASACDCVTNFSLGTLSFTNTVFARGGQTFSGSFASAATGANAFAGRFTGPAAEELIGSWTVPFLFEGATHQASGAWIAKRGN